MGRERHEGSRGAAFPCSHHRVARRSIDGERLGDLADLRAFCLVADLGSVTAAATRLGETKGSVSRRLSRLEAELGVVLVLRTPRLVEPTDEGREFRQRVGRALELLDDAALHARQAKASPRGHLRVTAPTDVALAMLGPVVASFRAAHPSVTVELVLTERTLDFDADAIDVAIRASRALGDSSLVAHKIADVEGRLFASPAYLAAHGAPRNPSELASRPLLLGGAERGRAMLRLSSAAGGAPVELPVRAAISASDYSFARAVALEGAGIALLPVSIANADVAAGGLVPVLEDWVGFAARLYLVHKATRLLTPKVKAFRDHVLAATAATARRGRARA